MLSCVSQLLSTVPFSGALRLLWVCVDVVSISSLFTREHIKVREMHLDLAGRVLEITFRNINMQILN